MVEKREAELAKAGAVERQNVADPKPSAVIDRYIEESIKEIGRTKAQVLATIKNFNIADLKCSEAPSRAGSHFDLTVLVSCAGQADDT